MIMHISALCMGVYIKSTVSCTDTQFPTDIDTTETEVEIKYCPLDEVPAGALDHLTSLERFRLTHMPTLQAFPNVTAVGSTLTNLELWHNAISYINPDFLNALVVLQLLNLGENTFLSSIPDVPSLTSLTQLYIHGNNFTEVPHLTDSQSMRVLDISDNPITTIKQEDFEIMKAIKILVLKESTVNELPDFFHLSKLVDLCLDGSSLNLMPAHHTAVLAGLKELSLRDTVQLEFVSTLCSKQPEELNIDISGSGLRLCHCHHAWLKAAAEAGATVTMQTAAMCGGQAWHNMSTAQFMVVCEQYGQESK